LILKEPENPKHMSITDINIHLKNFRRQNAEGRLKTVFIIQSLALSPQQFIFIFFLTPFFFIASCKSKGNQSGAQPGSTMPATQVQAMVIQPQPLERKINITGSIIANEEVELRSEVAGKVTGIYFSEGSRVTKGQLLVKINDNDLQAQLKKLVLQDTLISRDEFRKKKLLEMNAVSKEEYDNAITQLQSVRAEKEFVLAQIAKTEIRAPFDGAIGLRNISEGGYAPSSFLVATMQQVNPVKIEFSVPERYRDFLKSGTSIQFTVTGSENIFKGTVYAVEAKIDPVTRTVKVRARSENDKNRLIPGAFAKVELILEKINDAIVIPAQTVVPEMNGQKVFLIKNGKAKSSQVELGIRTDRDTEILSGIAPGDTLAITGLLQLRDGTSVNTSIVNRP
jgi:membrane fusion protein, multidrug efflux system